MIMQLDLWQVQVAVAEYLRKAGVIIGDAKNVRLEIRDRSGARMSIAGCEPVVVVYDVELPESDGPYRNAAVGALKP